MIFIYTSSVVCAAFGGASSPDASSLGASPLGASPLGTSPLGAPSSDALSPSLSVVDEEEGRDAEGESQGPITVEDRGVASVGNESLLIVRADEGAESPQDVQTDSEQGQSRRNHLLCFPSFASPT